MSRLEPARKPEGTGVDERDASSAGRGRNARSGAADAAADELREGSRGAEATDADLDRTLVLAFCAVAFVAAMTVTDS